MLPALSLHHPQVVSAFVTFTTADARRRALAALPRSLLRQWRMPPDRRFNNGGIGRWGGGPAASGNGTTVEYFPNLI